jgi:26S proteasome regulatory subunit T2
VDDANVILTMESNRYSPVLRRMIKMQVDLEKFVQSRDELSGADIKAICTEAGMLALRERRMKVCQEDFVKAKEKALYRKKGNIPEGLYL